MISIHAAREGGDADTAIRDMSDNAFQSTPPVKAATIAELWFMPSTPRFQSTPPVKAATFQQRKGFVGLRISIHAAREGGDA